MSELSYEERIKIAKETKNLHVGGSAASTKQTKETRITAFSNTYSTTVSVNRASKKGGKVPPAPNSDREPLDI